MSLRKEVFQAKVLQRLYPAAREVEKVLEMPVHHPQGVQLKPSKVTGHVGVPAVSGRKVYTVLPPPKDYVPASGDGLWSPTDAQLVNNADEMPADLSGSEDRDADEDDGRASIKRKRRRKRKAATVSEGNTPSAAADDDKAEDAEERSKGNAEGSECLSKNKRRKMKKKRHKEKLLALGLVPRSTAVEFTYKESEGKEEEEDGHKKVEEVLDFLHSTRDLYLSDRSRSTGDPSVFLSATESLSARLSDGTSPPAVLSVLCRLGALLRRREVEELHTVLQEFTHTTTLPEDETEVICTLFHYWITEVLPVQTDQLT
ncbi:glutamate-rich protein 1 [Ictalurus furcatus]|uniref:glutamate-rich protein 1 n=1 Tax=Ictalurus furcatus TaxID=66913 RepID=UPI0023507936|nr:glutamate-rich protein 1 [Ictalurus furcatus]